MAESYFKRKRYTEDGTEKIMHVYEYFVEGMKTPKTFYGSSMQKARAKLDEFKKQMCLGEFVAPNKMTVGAYIDYWLNVVKKVSVSPETNENYKQRLEHFKKNLGTIRLQKLKPKDVQECINIMNETLSPYTIQRSFAVFKQCLKHATIQKNKIISSLPIDGIELPKKKVVPKKLITPEEYEEIKKKYGDNPLFPSFVIQMRQGLRQGEVLGLTTEDIDLKNKVIYIRKQLKRTMKTGATKTEQSIRKVPMHPEVFEVLEHFVPNKSNEGFLFCTKKGKPIHHRTHLDNFHRMFGKGYKGDHTLRHTFTTQLMEAVGDATVVAAMLGHTDTRMVNDVYNHSSMERMRSAIEKLQ